MYGWISRWGEVWNMEHPKVLKTVIWAPGSFQGKALLSRHLQQQSKQREADATSSSHRDSKYLYLQSPRFSLFTTFDLMNRLISVEFSLPGLFQQVLILILFLPITTSKALRFNSSNPQKLSQSSSSFSQCSEESSCFLQTRKISFTFVLFCQHLLLI